jgi:ABC-type phosphate/phosphonate transport system substrate-binding protein
MIASLGMYDRAETREANDRFWALIRDALRAEGVDAPQDLTRGEGAYWPAWTSPELLFSQTCGFPYRARLHGKVRLIGTPDYGLEGCPPGHYRSVFVARAGDPRTALADFDGAGLAFNEDLSQSGWAAPQNHARALGLSLRPVLRSGGHLLSARAVAEGRAEIAALDALTWALIQEWEPVAAGLKVVGHTTPTPALPYITHPSQDAGLLFRAVAGAIAGLAAGDRATLRLKGLVALPPEAYLSVPTPPTPADLGLT